MKNKLLILFGKSAAGKDTMLHYLEKAIPNSHIIVSHTSRPPRDYEIQDKDYHFVSLQEFEKLRDNYEMLEYTYFNGWYYGTHKSEIKPDVINIGVFNPTGVYTLTHDWSDQIDILPVYIQVDDKTRLLRSLTREICPDCHEICRRFLADEAQFSQFENKFDYEIFLNDSEYDYGYDAKFHAIFNRPKVAKFLEGHI